MRIERAGPQWLEAVCALERRCFTDPWPEAVMARRLPEGLLCLEGERLLGYVILSHVLDEGSIDDLAVDPAYRRRGAGRALVLAAEQAAAALGLGSLTLEVRAGNEAALALYRGTGFCPVGRRKNYYVNPREDAILMTRVLKSDVDIGI